MATWHVWVEATKNGQRKLHKSCVVKGETEPEAKANALAHPKSSQVSYSDCNFSVTTAKKVRDN
jgi:hypothetical protein